MKKYVFIFLVFVSLNAHAEIGLHMGQVFLIRDYANIKQNITDTKVMGKLSLLTNVDIVRDLDLKGISVLEVDVTFSEEKNMFVVSYGIHRNDKLLRIQTFSGGLLSLDLFLKKVLHHYDFKGIWLDAKNLTVSNASKVSKSVEFLSVSYPQLFFLLESSDRKALHEVFDSTKIDSVHPLFWLNGSDCPTVSSNYSQHFEYFYKNDCDVEDKNIYIWTNGIQKQDSKASYAKKALELHPKVILVDLDYLDYFR
ncbi:hypothetical protein ACMXYR_02720 [Neptuniibacter sp. QD29_5]|uniref:hypothetical protein n=1 Tax=Neptuniibacter sp. QD29_5 TaxID=3398207 RepID=UPI0039F568FA